MIWIGQRKDILQNVFRIPKRSIITQKKRFQLGHWSFVGPGDEDKWYGTHNDELEGKWNITADVMVDNFKES